MGNTSVLVSAVCGWAPASSDFLPLQVDYREKAFAGGVIPSTFSRREANSSDRETLAARIIDRSLRPLFPKGFYYDTQIICSLTSFDKDCDPGMLSVIAASAALHVSSIPFDGPIAAARVGWLGGRPVLAPSYEEEEASALSLLYTGTADKTVMMEVAADQLAEPDLIRAMRFAQDELQPVLALQNELRRLGGKEKKPLPLSKVPHEVMAAVHELIFEEARAAFRQHHYSKAERGNAQRLLFLKIKEELGPRFPSDQQRFFGGAGDAVMKAALRSLVAEAADAAPLAQLRHCHPLRGPVVEPATPHLPHGDAEVVARIAAGEGDAASAGSAAPASGASDVGSSSSSSEREGAVNGKGFESGSEACSSETSSGTDDAAAGAAAELAVAAETAPAACFAAEAEAGSSSSPGEVPAAEAEMAPADAPLPGPEDVTPAAVAQAAQEGAVVAPEVEAEAPAEGEAAAAAAAPAVAVAAASAEAEANIALSAAAEPSGAAAVGAAEAAAGAAKSADAATPVAAPADALAAAEGDAAASAAPADAEAEPAVRAVVVDDGADWAPEDRPHFRLTDARACRPDGRGTTDIRPLRCEVDVLPVVHGSAIFSRGNTQVLCTATLGPLDQAQVMRPPGGGGQEVRNKNFFLHYDFPPYSTNETGRVGGANRRMVGHGALAERALLAVMPDEAEFPYTVRVTSEVTGSDGSSSMATVCGATLALMDAGVPIKTPVAGISVGSYCPPAAGFDPNADPAADPADRPGYFLLTDIFGLEDHAGDMDFKVAGTRYGVTGLQLDVKPAGLPLEVLEQALWRARDARLRVLDRMAQTMSVPRSEVKEGAPRLEQMLVPPELLGKIIGPGGAVVKKIQAATGAKVAIDRQADGSTPRVSIYATAASLAAARGMIHSTLDEHRKLTGAPLSYVTSPGAPALQVGDIVRVSVLRVLEFGAVMGRDGHEVGWLHSSELTPHRGARVADYLSEGDVVTAQVCDVDIRGRGKLSVRTILQPGEDARQYIERAAPRAGAPAAAAAAVVPAAPVAVAGVEAAGAAGVPTPALPASATAAAAAPASVPIVATVTVDPATVDSEQPAVVTVISAPPAAAAVAAAPATAEAAAAAAEAAEDTEALAAALSKAAVSAVQHSHQAHAQPTAAAAAVPTPAAEPTPATAAAAPALPAARAAAPHVPPQAAQPQVSRQQPQQGPRAAQQQQQLPQPEQAATPAPVAAAPARAASSSTWYPRSAFALLGRFSYGELSRAAAADPARRFSADVPAPAAAAAGEAAGPAARPLAPARSTRTALLAAAQELAACEYTYLLPAMMRVQRERQGRGLTAAGLLQLSGAAEEAEASSGEALASGAGSAAAAAAPAAAQAPTAAPGRQYSGNRGEGWRQDGPSRSRSGGSGQPGYTSRPAGGPYRGAAAGSRHAGSSSSGSAARPAAVSAAPAAGADAAVASSSPAGVTAASESAPTAVADAGGASRPARQPSHRGRGGQSLSRGTSVLSSLPPNNTAAPASPSAAATGTATAATAAPAGGSGAQTSRGVGDGQQRGQPGAARRDASGTRQGQQRQGQGQASPAPAASATATGSLSVPPVGAAATAAGGAAAGLATQASPQRPRSARPVQRREARGRSPAQAASAATASGSPAPLPPSVATGPGPV
jgi:polyribonucleotide nucleotidyltransferase